MPHKEGERITDVTADAHHAQSGRIPVLFADRLSMWSGLAMCVLIGVGFLAGGLIPPPSPSASAVEVAEFYSDNVVQRRLGLLVMTFGAFFMIPFGMAIANEMRRILGRPSTLVPIQIAATTFLATTTTVYLFFMLTATYRPERPSELMVLLSDLAWIPFVGLWQSAALQALVVAATVFTVPAVSPNSIWPRWIGWLSLWYAFTSVVGCFVPFFRSGPFAWNGVLTFYVGAAALFAFWMAMVFVMLRTTRSATWAEAS